MPTEVQTERRRTTRIPLTVRVILCGLDADGFAFVEETETVTVSKHGSSVRTSHTLAISQDVSVRTKVSNRVGQFQVVWVGQGGTSNEGLVGLEWIEAQELWGLDFPPMTEESESCLL